MSADKYPSIFSRQMKAIVYLSHNAEHVERELERRLKDLFPTTFQVLALFN